MDIEITNWLSQAKTKYQQIRNLVENEPTENSSNFSKVFEPYKDKYTAKNVLDELLQTLTILQTNASNNDSFASSSEGLVLIKRLKMVRGLLLYELGYLSCEVQEPAAGEDYCMKALSCIPDEELDDSVESCLLAINVRNQLGVLWTERGEPEKAKNFLVKAETLYLAYYGAADASRTEVIGKHAPFSFLELLTYPNSCRENSSIDGGFGKSHVHTLYYLAQVYERLEESKLAASYCHKTLKWQIEKQNYNPLEWSLNCATLSQFFVSRDRFPIARYLLTCASYTLRTQTDCCQDDTPDEEADEKKEILNRTRADVARCWSNYCISLLSSSRDKLMDAAEAQIESKEKDETRDETMSELMKSLQTECNLEEYLLIDQELIKAFEAEQEEQKITDNYILDFDDARKAFLSAQAWINRSKEFYTLTEYASDYGSIVQNTSKLFDHLSFFEDNDDRKCKMHKRRVDMLEELLNALSPQYFLNLRQQILFELGETYTKMMHLKLSGYDPKKGAKNNVRAVNKINSLVEKGIRNFQCFLDTLKTKDGVDPEKYPVSLVRPALLARFYIGQLYSKFIVLIDQAKRMTNLKEIEKNYEYVRDYVAANPDHESCIVNELEVFKEMADLVPARLQQEMSATLY